MTNYDGVSWPEAASAEDLKLVSDEMLARRREAAAYYDIMGWRQLGANGYEFKVEGTDPIFDAVGFKVGRVINIFADPDNPTNQTNDFSLTIPLYRGDESVMDIIKLSYKKNSQELVSMAGARVDGPYVENLSSSMLERARALTELDEPVIEADESDPEFTEGYFVTHESLEQARWETTERFGDDIETQFQFGVCDKKTTERILEILRRSSPVEPATTIPYPEAFET